MTPVSSSVCLLCGAPLKSRRPHARHCSGACRAEASRLRAILRGARSSPLTIRRRPPQGRPKAHKGAAGHMSKRHKRGRSKGWKGDPRPLGKWTICEASASRPILRMSSLGPKPRRRVRLSASSRLSRTPGPSATKGQDAAGRRQEAVGDRRAACPRQGPVSRGAAKHRGCRPRDQAAPQGQEARLSLPPSLIGKPNPARCPSSGTEQP
jgi:hypothetical protein